MCSLFSVGSRTRTGQVSSTVCAGMRAAAKTPLPDFISRQLMIMHIEEEQKKAFKQLEAKNM